MNEISAKVSSTSMNKFEINNDSKLGKLNGRNVVLENSLSSKIIPKVCDCYGLMMPICGLLLGTFTSTFRVYSSKDLKAAAITFGVAMAWTVAVSTCLIVSRRRQSATIQHAP